MNRTITIGAMVLTAGISFGLYQLSYEAQRLEEELAEYNRALMRDREAIQVLHAEWSYLTRPEVLQERAARNLDLAPLLPHQIVEAGALTARLDEIEALSPRPPVPRARPGLPRTPPGAQPPPDLRPAPGLRPPDDGGRALVAATPPRAEPRASFPSDTARLVPVLASAKVTP